jgi:UDP:flavonoid glycosyltransferase YjiC (YdhE family)
LTPVRKPLAPVDLAAELRRVGTGFGRRVTGSRAAELVPFCQAWRPDVMVCEEVDFGAMVAAKRLGLPHATVLVIAAGGFVRPEFVAGPLDEVRAAHGLPPDPELAMLSRHLVLSPFPPSYRDPAWPLPANAVSFRLAEPAPAAPTWLAEMTSRPLVYFTLGTVFNVESGDLFQRVLAGLRELPISVVVTVGGDIDPAELGPQPANVRVERFVPQAALLPHARAVVSHGGSGSVLGALVHGRPMVLIPMGADQPLNSARCAALGLARVLDPLAATPDDVRAAVADVLENPGYRLAAERLRDELAALPGLAEAESLLERLA